MLSLLATGPISPISISISPDYLNDGLQAAYVILALIIVITAMWSIRLNRKQSQAALEESRSQSQEALKVTNEQIAKNEQQAKASLEAIYEQIASSKQQAQDAFYNQIRPILVCTGQPQVTLINMENVGFGVTTDVWGMYCVKPTDESPPFSSSFAKSMILLPHKEKAISLLEDNFQTCLSREGETNSGTWSCIVAGLVGLAHWDGDQTHGEQTPQGGRAPHEPRFAGASNAALAAFKGRARAQHVLHRTVEWDCERTAGDLHAHVSPCRSAAPGSGDRHVLDWEHLQLLLFPSRTQHTSSGRNTETPETDASDGERSDRPSVESL